MGISRVESGGMILVSRWHIRGLWWERIRVERNNIVSRNSPALHAGNDSSVPSRESDPARPIPLMVGGAQTSGKLRPDQVRIIATVSWIPLPREHNCLLPRLVAGLLVLVATQIGCGPSRKPTVESLETAQPRTLPFSFSSLEGRRDGDRVSAILEFQGADSRDRLILRFNLDLGPPISLANGTYQLQTKGTTSAGNIEAPSIDFQAGQSGGMGLGGRFFLLDDKGRRVFRVTLPHTLIGATYH